MKIISLWDEKGGCGKSTLAWALAGAAVNQGLKVLLIDEDPQASCMMLAGDNNVDFKTVDQWPSDKPNVDLVIVDMAPNTNTIPSGSVILPYQPTRLSYSVAAKHKDRLADKCDRVIELVSGVDMRLKNHVAFLKNNSALQMRYRSVYERLTNDAASLYSKAFKNLSGAREARNEIDMLLKEALK